MKNASVNDVCSKIDTFRKVYAIPPQMMMPSALSMRFCHSGRVSFGSSSSSALRGAYSLSTCSRVQLRPPALTTRRKKRKHRDAPVCQRTCLRLVRPTCVKRSPRSMPVCRSTR